MASFSDQPDEEAQEQFFEFAYETIRYEMQQILNLILAEQPVYKGYDMLPHRTKKMIQTEVAYRLFNLIDEALLCPPDAKK